ATLARVLHFKAKTRDAGGAATAVAALEKAARGTENWLPFILHAVKARATLGEIADGLRRVFGEYRPHS
ncbi:MAG TPA: methylmalonyl-CoA mutase family protein, partial [Polyangia bacterium]|nr:methylmalonyl-CoA mutase family protein [Polyangia bacterium]